MAAAQINKMFAKRGHGQPVVEVVPVKTDRATFYHVVEIPCELP